MICIELKKEEVKYEIDANSNKKLRYLRLQK